MRNPKTEVFYPFNGRHSGITAYVDPPYQWEDDQEIKYRVNWPSIGSVGPEEARQFAATIIKACDWLDAQKESEPQQPVITTNADIDVPGDRREL